MLPIGDMVTLLLLMVPQFISGVVAMMSIVMEHCILLTQVSFLFAIVLC